MQASTPQSSPSPQAPLPSTASGAGSTLLWQVDAQGRLQPYSPQFDDIYRSSGQDGQGGWQQARYVFLQGCGLLAGDMAAHPLWASQAQWHILETGLGLGLNFLATWQAWAADAQRPSKLIFSSVEAYPVGSADITLGAADFPALAPYAAELAAAWQPQPGLNRWQFAAGAVELHLYIGDVAAMLPQLQTRILAQKIPPADSVFLDGFNPKSNADMWALPCLQNIAACARAEAQLASWTVAASVRDNLSQAGFRVRKRPGLPPKRHCLQAEI